MKITKLETYRVKPRWLFLKMHTDEGLVGLGEPILEGRARTVAEAVAELAEYLVGQDPRRIEHHWQAMYRHAFYRGGPILTSALSGVEQAMDFHGQISPAMAVRLAQALEPFYPFFIEEPCLPENVDTMVTVARSTSIPIATGERLFTKWGFRQVLEKQAAAIVQPDLC